MKTIYHIVRSLKLLQGLFLHSAMAVQPNLIKHSKCSSVRLPHQELLCFPAKKSLTCKGCVVWHCTCLRSCWWAAGWSQQRVCLGKAMCFLGHVKSVNTIVMSPGFSLLADEQHLAAADLLAKGNMALKQFQALYSLCGVWCFACCKT